MANDTYINCVECNWTGMASGIFCPSCGHNCYPMDDESSVGSNPGFTAGGAPEQQKPDESAETDK